MRLDDEKRNAKPESPSAGPIYGPELIGGDGSSLWTDADKCAGQYVTGFRIWHGDEVDTVQFQYGSNGWGETHGRNNEGRGDDEVILAAGDSIVRIDYREADRVDMLTFTTSKGKKYGPYGRGNPNPGTYLATSGERLACVAGRAGSKLDRLIFSSSGLR